jgi:hypothetical protein
VVLPRFGGGTAAAPALCIAAIMAVANGGGKSVGFGATLNIGGGKTGLGWTSINALAADAPLAAQVDMGRGVEVSEKRCGPSSSPCAPPAAAAAAAATERSPAALRRVPARARRSTWWAPRARPPS